VILSRVRRGIYFALLLLVCVLFAPFVKAQTVAPMGGIGITQWIDNSGAPLVNGALYTYVAGTTTQQATYTDSTGLTLNPNPVLFGAGGRVNVWLASGQLYKFVLCSVSTDGPVCAGGHILAQVDNVPGGGAGGATGSCSPSCTGTFISGSGGSPATTGILRLQSGDQICWRNAAGSTNLCLSKDTNDLLTWAGGSLKLPEVGAPGCVAGFDLIWADSTAHRLKQCNNGGTADTVVGAATTDTFTNKTYDAQGSGNVFKIGGVTVTNANQAPGTFLNGAGTWSTSNLKSEFQNNTAVTISNNNTEQTLMTFTLAANDLSGTQYLDIFGSGNVQDGSGTTNYTLKIYLDANVINTVIIPSVSIGNSAGWEVTGRYGLVTGGAGGTIECQAKFLTTLQGTALINGTASGNASNMTVNSSTFAFDTTATQVIKVTTTMSSANAANLTQQRMFHINRIG
jgi:hypothetical protein